MQHVLAMFVGNIVPMILVASTANLSDQDLQHAAPVLYAGRSYFYGTAALIHLRSAALQFGSGLPCMMGLTYVFLPACLSIAGSKGIPYVFGARIRSRTCSHQLRYSVKKDVAFLSAGSDRNHCHDRGVSIFNLAIGDFTGGTSSPDFGAPINWAVRNLCCPGGSWDLMCGVKASPK